MKGIPENIKLIAKSIAPFLISILLFILVGNFGIARINDVRAQISEARINQNVLGQKVETIQAISGTVGNFSSAATVALPDANTALAVIGQMKSLALTNGIILTNIKTGPATNDASGLSRVDISFDAEGSRTQISTFLKASTGIAPITIIDRIKISETGGVAKAGVVAKSFWAPLPASVPTSTQTLNGLTSDEQATLTRVSALSQPLFFEITPSSGGKTDPFAQ
jgi:hypothetical protein